ncbi:SLC13 family permease [Methanosphaerula palustris]|uniref:Citrate transporter n=1 Tax=Methanosphaerula palustris (strain ATCC BAA-1556 / DSM 19958 / E1-9c) TaxID=521011 RepID=B8GFG6_METPE|nr:SLC13 family permease [Methanosphaerula palustris]ACL16014.1 Citrate transporter [Methanosphaerula palustris E1-9c]
MVLAAVFLLIAVRQVGRLNLKIWQVMLGGAVAVLVTGQIAPIDALGAVDPDVMLFLFGMFIVGEAFVASGYLFTVGDRIFCHTKTPDQVVLAVLFGAGLLSALLMNDTLAIIGTPLVLGIASRTRISPKLLLLTLAVAITTGSLASPVGNPQNLLVAVNGGIPSPFITFGTYLLVPTLIGLLLAYLVLRLAYRREFQPGKSVDRPACLPTPAGDPPAFDRHLALLAKSSIVIIVLLAGVNIAASTMGGGMTVPLPLIALAAALPIILLSPRRFEVIRTIDWPTLVFFAAMFVLMESVWRTGFFQQFVSAGGLTTVPALLATSVLFSQFISNVPFVALFLPMVLQAGGTPAQLMALAAGSTLAGNLTILGAASNVIIVQNAEKQGETLTFAEFARVGVPLTLLQMAVYWVFLDLL